MKLNVGSSHVRAAAWSPALRQPEFGEFSILALAASDTVHLFFVSSTRVLPLSSLAPAAGDPIVSLAWATAGGGAEADGEAPQLLLCQGSSNGKLLVHSVGFTKEGYAEGAAITSKFTSLGRKFPSSIGCYLSLIAAQEPCFGEGVPVEHIVVSDHGAPSLTLGLAGCGRIGVLSLSVAPLQQGECQTDCSLTEAGWLLKTVKCKAAGGGIIAQGFTVQNSHRDAVAAIHWAATQGGQS